jgi:hypothetical protein
MEFLKLELERLAVEKVRQQAGRTRVRRFWG